VYCPSLRKWLEVVEKVDLEIVNIERETARQYGRLQ